MAPRRSSGAATAAKPKAASGRRGGGGRGGKALASDSDEGSSASSSSEDASASGSVDQEVRDGGENGYSSGDAASSVAKKGKKRGGGELKAKPVSKKQRTLDSLNSDPGLMELIVSSAVRFILYSDAMKTPVTMSDLNKVPFKEHKGVGVGQSLMPSVESKFLEVFGLELYEIERDTKAKTKAFLLKSALPKELRKIVAPRLVVESNQLNDEAAYGEFTSGEVQAASYGLLMVILALIFLHNKDSIEEDILFNDLDKLGFARGQPHPQFRLQPGRSVASNVQAWEHTIRSVLPQQLYLKKTDEGNPTVTTYGWGERARREIRMEDVLKFIAMIRKDKNIDPHWLLEARGIDEKNGWKVEKDVKAATQASEDEGEEEPSSQQSQSALTRRRR